MAKCEMHCGFGRRSGSTMEGTMYQCSSYSATRMPKIARSSVWRATEDSLAGFLIGIIDQFTFPLWLVFLIYFMYPITRLLLFPSLGCVIILLRLILVVTESHKTLTWLLCWL